MHAIEYQLERGKSSHVSSSLLMLGSCMAVFGFGIYYVFPLSLLSMNLTLLLNMFFFLLLGMLFGLILLSSNFQHLLERGCTHLLLCFERRPIRHIIIKNLVAHRKRNRQTAILYALSLGFILFIAVSYDIQAVSFVYGIEKSHGVAVDVEFMTPIVRNATSEYDIAVHAEVISKLETECSRSKIVESWSWITHPAMFAHSRMQQSQITNVGNAYQAVAAIVRVCELVVSFFSKEFPRIFTTQPTHIT